MLIIAGILFMLFMFAIVDGLSGMLAYLVDLPSMLLILVPLLFFLCASKNGGIIAKYVKSSFRKDCQYSKTGLKAF